MWVFGFGSLMWDGWHKEHGCILTQKAELVGYRRRFNKASVKNWGTKQTPGPTLNIEECSGCSCLGMAFKFPHEKRLAVIEYLKEREGKSFDLVDCHVTLVNSGEKVVATVPIYSGRNVFDKPLNELVDLAIMARGARGRCIDYIMNVAKELSNCGISDPEVDAIAALVKSRELGKLERSEAKVGAVLEDRYAAINGSGVKVDPGRAIVPIFKRDNNGALRLIGTGFFICNVGILVTAAHVLKDVIGDNGEQKNEILVIQFDNSVYYTRPLARGIIKNNADVALAVCREMRHNKTGELLKNAVLTVCKTPPKVGDVVHTYAYPDTVYRSGFYEEIHMNPHCYQGEVTEIFPNGRDSVFLPSCCYQTSIVLHGGASGGPVFNQNGHVIGINSTGFSGCQDISFISTINDIFDLSISGIKLSKDQEAISLTLRELEGMGHVSVN